MSYSTSAELLTLHFGDEQLEAQWASVEFSLDQMCEMAAALVASQNGGVLPAEAALALRALNPRIK